MKGSSQGAQRRAEGARPDGLHSAGRERPSTHGALVGEAIARIAESVTGELPGECCATCAFRRGCMTNQMASTVLVAFRCAVGVDPSPFACHHGMKDGEPTKVCAGWLATTLADYDVVRAVSEWVTSELAKLEEGAPDPIREAFDAWISSVDPDGRMNDYERGRLYLRSFGRPLQNAQPGEAAPSGVAPGQLREDQ